MIYLRVRDEEDVDGDVGDITYEKSRVAQVGTTWATRRHIYQGGTREV